MSDNIKGRIYAIEGNIGAGKSTIITHLERLFQEKGYKTISYPEGVDDTPLKTLLFKFYEDQPKWAFTLQIAFYTRLYWQLMDAIKHKEMGYICFLDRSLFGNNVFTNLHYELGNISYEQFEFLQSLITDYPYMDPVDDIIYVRTCPNICYKRMLKRGREIVDIPYLVKLDNMYLKMLTESSGRTKINPMEFDWSRSITEGLEFLESFVDTVSWELINETIED